MRILLVEDVADLADAVRAHLAALGYQVEWCAD
jgi:DNA-binding response OmpR family regulator